ncbi:hypothetical protein ACH4E7_23655 [Kitasatospora sp. NPDC018058]|uniref:hypothetical protein n=1 Tax=Kitasatospora sp. NPDC018058 TaxID=3364025 RepID=UPI0037BF9365
MGIRQFTAAAGVIGRRNALRYLALGVGSALVAACSSSSGSDSATTADSGSAAPPNSDPTATGQAPAPAAPTAKPTVADRAFDAFVRGSWTVQSTSSRGKPLHSKVTVQTDGGGNGGWTLTFDGLSGKDGTWRGSFLLRGGHLSLDIVDGPAKLAGEHRSPEALNVPATVGDTVQVTLPWQPPGSNDSSKENLAVTYDGTTLTIVHTSGSSRTTHACTRA